MELDEFYSYSQIQASHWPTVHFITQKNLATKNDKLRFVTLTIASDFGAFSTRCVFPSGEEFQVPPGLPHILEHVLLRMSHNTIREIKRKTGGRVGGAITEDKLLLYCELFMTSRAQQADFITGVLNLLLKIFFDKQDIKDIREAFKSEQQRIKNELYIGSKETLEKALRQALFHTDTIHYGAGGDHECFDSLTENEVSLGRLISNKNIASIVIHTYNEFEEDVFERVTKVIDYWFPLYTPKVFILGPEEPHNIRTEWAPIPWAGGKEAFGLYGIKLRPLPDISKGRPDLISKACLQFFLQEKERLNKEESGVDSFGSNMNKAVITTPFTGKASRYIRAYTLMFPIDNPVTFLDTWERRRMKNSCRNKMIEVLEEQKIYLPRDIKFFLYYLLNSRHGLTRLCLHGDTYGVDLTSMLEEYQQGMDRTLIDCLIAEIYNSTEQDAIAFETVVFQNR
mgnify:CR=1 FL=1